MTLGPIPPLNGALIIHKHAGVSSFGIIEILQRQLTQYYHLKRKDLPKIGHGGTLDPFATGVLVVCVGNAVKIARYFLGANKGYRGIIRFGETTVPGDPTGPITETSAVIPDSLSHLQEMATKFAAQPYLQIPPMHSAKKKDGRPLYELAREGIEVERDPKLCHLYRFNISSYTPPKAEFDLLSSSGTYVRTLAQDFGRWMGSVALLETLERTSAGNFTLESALTTQQLEDAMKAGQHWDELSCWVPFDRLLEGFATAEATPEEALALSRGQQGALINIVNRAQPPLYPLEGEARDCLGIYLRSQLVAVARQQDGAWGIDRVFHAPNLNAV